MSPPWYDFIFDNTYQVDAVEAEKHVREKYPLLLHDKEKILLAFKDRGGKGRDKEYFTTHRILFKDGKGIGSKRKNYISVPYNTIQAYSVQSAGASFIDGDSELVIYATGYERLSIDFASTNVDIFQVYQFINSKIDWSKHVKNSTTTGTTSSTSSSSSNDDDDSIINSKPPNMDQKQTTAGNMIDWIGDNAKQIDAFETETKFKTEFPILLSNEKVYIAFKSGRDTTFFTNLRIIMIDVKGIASKRIEFLTLLYSAIHGFAVQTAGSFMDRDTELRLYTNRIDHLYQMNQDFRHGKANLWAIQKVLCNHVLGDDREPIPDIDKYEGHVDPNKGGTLWGIVSGLRFNERPVDSIAMDNALHIDPPILQGSEHVEMAFQGHRDITLFTTKRLLLIDKKGITGQRIEYFSVPWEKIVAFAIRTAGAYIDYDTEILLYTEMGFYPGQAGELGGDGEPPKPPIPPRPEQSCLEVDLNKNMVDMFKLKYYLSRRIMDISRIELGASIGLETLTSASPDPAGFERLFQWLGSDQRELDPTELDVEFHTNTHILLDDEKCLMAFKAGRDVSLFTNRRIMIIDVQGLVGCKIEYTSVPYRSIHAYSIQSAGIWDRDSELTLYTRNRWHIAKIDMDFRSGKTDIIQIQKFLTGYIIGLPTDTKIIFGPKNYMNHERDTVGFNSLAVGFFENSKEMSIDERNELDIKFHTDIPLLLVEETILRSFKQARDMYIYTNRRILIVDTKGISGQRVQYKTIPHTRINAFEYETAGHLDRDAEIYGYTNISHIQHNGIPRSVGLLKMKHSILVKTTNIYEMGKLFVDYVLFGEKQPIDMEPEIEVTSYE